MTLAQSRRVALSMDHFKGALRRLLDENLGSSESERYRGMITTAQDVLQCAETTQELHDIVSNLCEGIQDCVQTGLSKTSLSSKREAALIPFEELTMTAFPFLWESIYSRANVTISDPLLSQTTNQALFDMLFNEAVTPVVSQGQSEALCSVEQELSIDEENALRYMSGYVPFKLIKKF